MGVHSEGGHTNKHGMHGPGGLTAWHSHPPASKAVRCPPSSGPACRTCTMQHGSFLLFTNLPASCFFRSLASNLVAT